MLWTIFVILIVLWILGMVTGYTIGGFIHILLVSADNRLNLEPYICDRVPALFPILCETPADQLFNFRVQVCWKSIQVRLAHDDGSERFRDSLGMECMAAREHLMQHAAKRKDVAALIGGVSFRLLGRHVTGGAEDNAATHGSGAEQRWRVRRGLGRRNLERLGQAEVEDLDLILLE